jgi:hypothetical protein
VDTEPGFGPFGGVDTEGYVLVEERLGFEEAADDVPADDLLVDRIGLDVLGVEVDGGRARADPSQSVREAS